MMDLSGQQRFGFEQHPIAKLYTLEVGLAMNSGDSGPGLEDMDSDLHSLQRVWSTQHTAKWAWFLIKEYDQTCPINKLYQTV